MNTLTLMQWNACSFNQHRRLELRQKCDQIDIDVIVICEAKIDTPPKEFDDYVRLKNNDTIMLINKRVQCQVMEEVWVCKPHIETIVIELPMMILIGVYCRNGRTRQGIADLINTVKWANHDQKPVCVIGDLNARAKLVYEFEGRRNPAGVELDKHLDDEVVYCLNDGMHTFHRSHCHSSVLDLCLVTKNLLTSHRTFAVMDWFDSDHHPIVCTFGSAMISHTKSSQYEQEYYIRSLNLMNKNLDKLPAAIDKLMDEHDTWCEHDADQLYDDIHSVILTALKTCGLLRKNTKKHSKAWFTHDIRQLIQDRDAAKLDTSDQGIHRYDQLKKDVKRAVKKAKRDKWYDFVESIRWQDSSAKLWRRFRMSRGTDRVFDTIGDLDTQTEHIAADFKKYSTVNIPKVRHWEDMYDQVRHSWHNTHDAPHDKMNAPILLTEVECAIRYCKSKSAPGPDGIPYSVYKCLPSSLLDKITTLFNMWFSTGQLAKQCEEGLQVAIPKGAPGEFRPITLKNALLKIFERVLYGRVYAWIDARLPEYQFGFRSKLGCREQLVRFIKFVEEQRAHNKTTVVLFLDIRKAYDRVYRKALICKLHKLGLRGQMLRAIDAIISGTRCRVLNRGHVSTEYEPEEGIPQGGVLSCLFWNIFFSDLPCNIQHQQHNVLYAAYADDLAIAVSATNEHDANVQLTAIYSKIRTWARFNRIEFNDNKVKSMTITPKRRRKRKTTSDDAMHTHLDRVVYLDENTGTVRRVDSVKSYKYLGVIIDHKLTFDAWIDKIVDNAKRRIHFVKRLAKTMRLPRHLLEKFYKSYVRGFLRYGIEIWSHARNAH